MEQVNHRSLLTDLLQVVAGLLLEIWVHISVVAVKAQWITLKAVVRPTV